MKIFIDTEFTDFVQQDLISIGLVSDDDRQFYGERNDYNRCDCSQFVEHVVLPQLGYTADCVFDVVGLRVALLAWLAQFESVQPVEICFDFTGDWQLFCALLDSAMPKWIVGVNINHQIDILRLEQFFGETRLARHHALHDAAANRFAYRPEQTDGHGYL